MAILVKGKTFTSTEQVTSTKLHQLVDSATFDPAAADGSTLEVSVGALRIKDAGVTGPKLSPTVAIPTGATAVTQAVATSNTSIATTEFSTVATRSITGGEAEVTIASATTTNIGTAAANRVLITGVVTITGLGASTNTVRFVRFSGALILTHNATTLILPGSASITTAAGDTMIVSSDGSGNWRCLSYQRASGLAVVVTTVNTAQLCKAWVNFNGTGTVAIRDQYNVSSITDNGVGNYTINFTSAMSNINYSISGCVSPGGGVFVSMMTQCSSLTASSAPTTGSIQVCTGNVATGSSYDPPYVNASVFSN